MATVSDPAGGRAVPEDEPTQRLLGGRYRLERVVGKGAMGKVWAAYDEVLGRPVAIKEVDFPAGMPKSEVDQIAQRTMREARAVASVSDPHVVTIFDMLSLPNGPAIVMELLSARSLAEILARDGTLSDTESAVVGLSVATGLLAAHSAGITHRDVKPGNVLICDDGRIKLTDFGIARSAGEQTITASGLLLGSPAYISPEVAAGRPANAQSDAWGLGALLFACVQGGPPFDQGTPLATLTSVVQDPVPPHPNSGQLSGVIRGLLVKDPSTRMSVGLAHQAMLRIAVDTGGLVTHAWKPAARAQRPPSANRPPLPPPPWATSASNRPGDLRAGPALPPPPWAGSAATALRPIPVTAPARSPRRKLALTAVALLVAVLAAAAGYFGVRVVAHLENGTPIAAADAAPVAALPYAPLHV
ncbi:Serine/threonine protein kinase [Nakamurella panacisegetis]|uniref:non-specific serine/threonine protein kinase n=1 Tax=Nakamurella panacisegetis TaxID=1090615 RepID=A0A1H0PCB5_9ACTN|nr:serine/threonine-protein kinase [Nakamurella panacisegetis]SDP02644.1 Serine/threonine protein kinase [Nakamurella panacisegetis]